MNARLQQFLERRFAASSLNRLPPQYGGGRIFDAPLIGVAAGDDPIFLKFKEVVGPEHLTPAEMWVQSGLDHAADPAARLRVVSIVFPYGEAIRQASKTAERFPAEIYCVGRNFANAFMDEVLQQTVSFFQQGGWRAASGMRSPVFQIVVKENPLRIYSVWSERHMAFAAGLGTFSLHEGFISEIGCNIRLTSVITDAPLVPTPRKTDDPYGNCLFYRTGKCRHCAHRCPGDAISAEGHDKLKCYLYGKVIEKEMTARIGGLLKPHTRWVNGAQTVSYPVGCAFCQFDVPCMDQNPVKEK